MTNKRSIKSTVLADDGQVIVLGGLIQDDLQRSDSRVPLLGDIPGVGRLFRSSRETRVKRNLMVFLRPSIVRDAAGLSASAMAVTVPSSCCAVPPANRRARCSRMPAPSTCVPPPRSHRHLLARRAAIRLQPRC